MTIENTNIHTQNNDSEYINKLTYSYFLWIYTCNELKWWQIWRKL